MDRKNRFSILLRQLMSVAELKNYMLAKDLQYDVSYISKWVSGQMLPAEKAKVNVLREISRCVVASVDSEKRNVLLNEYQVDNAQELECAIYDHLDAEYNYVRGLQKQTGASISPKTVFYPEATLPEYIAKMTHPVLRRVKSLDIMAAMDLLSIEHEYRLQIVDIRDANPSENHYYPDVHFSMLINLDVDKLDCVYDTVFLINMLSKNTKLDFQLYGSRSACGRVIFAVAHEFAISGMLAGPNRCLSVVTSEEQKTSDVYYDYVKNLCGRESLLFRRTSIYNMLRGHEYVRSLLSPHLRWVMGHMTEHFLPDDLFDEIVDRLAAQGKENDITREEIYDLHRLTHNLLEESDIQIVIYESAFADLNATGELDFFNYKVCLTPEQRRRYLEYLFTLCRDKKNLEVKLVYGELVTDFQYIANQCVFLSDMLSYLRLDNSRRTNNNLVIINRRDVQALFDSFYEHIWTECEEIVISDRAAISNYIRHTIQGSHLISQTGRDA